ncbi:MAG: ABC transporter ATP-binding protein, partial [Acidimicrobiales bacterium]|nr:ABC transporter ATP-binding protein [Acidimicrobiales bacterium]
DPVDDHRYAIEASHVSKRFMLGSRSTSIKDRLTGFSDRSRTEFWAVRDVSVAVEKGSMLGVIGRNGSGKSTFLRTLGGIYRPTEGEVRIRGRVTALLELGAGFHPELTGRENAYMNGAVVGLSRDYMDDVMGAIVEMADIGTFIDAPVETYSSGMKARLGFAVSVQLQPEVLLADEITAVGDITFREHGTRRMQALRESGVTIVQVSHSLSMLQDTCDQVLWLHQGEMMGLGDPAEVIADYMAHAASDTLTQARSAAAAEAVRPELISRIDVSPADGRAEPTVGHGLRLMIGLDVPEELVRPSLRLRFIRGNGAPTPYGITFAEMGDTFVGTAAISGEVPELPLLNGRYRLVIELLSDGEIVSVRKVPLDVKSPLLDGDPNTGFIELESSWLLS